MEALRQDVVRLIGAVESGADAEETEDEAKRKAQEEAERKRQESVENIRHEREMKSGRSLDDVDEDDEEGDEEDWDEGVPGSSGQSKKSGEDCNVSTELDQDGGGKRRPSPA